MFLDRVKGHKRCNILFDPSHFCLQQLNYLEYIDLYHERIKMFHVKDAEFNPTGRSGVYGGYQDWVNRPGRFRSLGDGQIDFALGADVKYQGKPLTLSQRKSKVVSSGAISPARAPASMDMLQMVIRSSMLSARIASPVYSTT